MEAFELYVQLDPTLTRLKNGSLFKDRAISGAVV